MTAANSSTSQNKRSGRGRRKTCKHVFRINYNVTYFVIAFPQSALPLVLRIGSYGASKARNFCTTINSVSFIIQTVKFCL